ncbi:MAG: hypothetical protein QOF36_1013 [Microbacteriaceae bacterium]|jgi:hypothetical protein|nr:hypothetical protein [Microbacteriaceae bacterium]
MDYWSLVISLFLDALPVVGPIVSFLLMLAALPFAIGAVIALVSAIVRIVRRFLPGSKPSPGAEYPDQTALDPWQRLEALDPELSRQS